MPQPGSGSHHRPFSHLMTAKPPHSSLNPAAALATVAPDSINAAAANAPACHRLLTDRSFMASRANLTLAALYFFVGATAIVI